MSGSHTGKGVPLQQDTPPGQPWQLGHRHVPERVPPAFSAEPTVSAYPLGSMCPVEITNTRALLRENLWRKKEGSGRKQGGPTDCHVGRTFVRGSCIGKSDCRAVVRKSWWGQWDTQTAREESTSDRKAPALTPPPRFWRVGAALGDANSSEVRGHTGHLFLQCEVWDVIVEAGWGMFNPFMVAEGNLHAWKHTHGVGTLWTCCPQSYFSLSHHLAAAAAAKSLQLCLTLCDPIDSSPPGSPVPGILQARTLEWVAISFSNAWKWKVKVKLLSHVWLLATPWTAAYQAPPSMGFSRQEYWSGVPLPSPFSPS